MRQDLQAVLGGAFPRSESGRTYRSATPTGRFAGQRRPGSRKDARDAVVAARKGFGAWSRRDAVQPGPGDLPDRRDAGGPAGRVRRPARSDGRRRAPAAGAEVDAAIDRLVHYAGWTDKLAAVFGGSNPVCRAVLLVLHPGADRGGRGGRPAAATPLLGLVSVIAPIIAGGNAVRRRRGRAGRRASPSPSAEVLATSDLPGGVVNMLTGRAAEIAPHLAAHGDVNALDLTGADAELRTELERAAAGTVKRVYRADGHTGLHRRPGHRPAAGVPGDQDRLAPDRRPVAGRWLCVLRCLLSQLTGLPVHTWPGSCSSPVRPAAGSRGWPRCRPARS